MDSPEKEKNKATDPINRLFNLNMRKAGLWVAVVFLPFCVFVWVASGYFYLPGRGSGLFLPTLPTFLIAASAAGLSLPSILSLMLYSKIMPDKKCQFFRIRRYSLKTAKYLLIAAIPVGVFEGIMLMCGLDLFSFLAVGKNIALWRPEMASLAGLELFNIDIYALVGPILASVVLAFLFFRWKRIFFSLLALSSFLATFLWLIMFAQGYFLGATGYSSETVYAIQDPAKFNAMAVWTLALAGFIFFIGLVALITAFTPSKTLAKAGKTKANR